MGRALTLAVGLSLCLHALTNAQQAANNTNVLPVVVNPLDPNAYLKGDLYLQRQVEPSIAASTRNPQTLLAFFNDYRAVDVVQEDVGIGETDNAAGGLLAWAAPIRQLLAKAFRRPARPVRSAPIAASEAWVGYSKSFDGGLTWTGGFLAGAPFDTSPASTSSPVYGLQAATDPVVSAAPCGRFYVVFLALTRGGQSKMAVATFEDGNNIEGGDSVRYLRTTVLESGNNATNGYFLDKPFLIVDPARGGGQEACAHNVYVSYTTFNGLEKDGKFKSKVTFAKSSDGGLSFTTQKLNMPFNQNQGTAIGVDPRPGTPTTTGGGTVYLIWRHFFLPDSMMVHRSLDYGATFSGKPVQLTAGAPLANLQKFDQPTQTTATHPPSQLTFRSNAFPTIAVSGTGAVFAAWQERVDITPGSATFGMPAATGSPRIVMMRSTDGAASWTDTNGAAAMRRAVDFADRDVTPPAPGDGYLPQLRPSGPQVMPRLLFGGGRLMLFYYESRGFVRQFPLEQIQLADLTDGYVAGIDRMLDMRAALLHPASGAVQGSAQVSRYPIKPWANLTDGEGLDDVLPVNAPCAPDFAPAPGSGELPPCVRRVNRSNLPQSGGGTAPFIGDYNDATAAVQFVPNAGGTGWRWAVDPADVPHPGFQVVFADNRNQIPPTGPAGLQDWERYRHYAAPGKGGSCLNAGSRNTDVLAARVNSDIVISAATTFKQLGTIQRAFPVTVANGTKVTKFYRMTFATPQMAGVASFSQSDATVDQIDIQVFGMSSVTLVTYIQPDAAGAVTVLVREVDALGGAIVASGASGQVTFNGDPSNPAVTSATIGNAETHESSVGTPLYQNPFYQNPLYQNPLYQNPLYQNPLYQNSTIYDVQQVTWSVQNAGNTASSYLALVHIDNAAAYTNDYIFLMTISKAASVGTLIGCDSANLAQEQIISSTILNPLYQNPLYQNPLYQNPLYQNPLYQNPLYQNATFAVAPAEGATGAGSHDGSTHAKKTADAVQVTLTAFRINPAPALVFDAVLSPPSVAVHAQSLNNIDGVLIAPPPSFFGSDLVFASTAPASLGTVQAGSQITFPADTWVLRNTGNTTATPVQGDIRYAIYLSTDATITTADRLLGFATTPPLAAGEERLLAPLSVTIPADVAGGEYYVGLFIDDPLAVSELSEANNIVTASVTVTGSNTAPSAANQSVTTAEDTPVAIVLAGADAESDPLSFVVLSGPAGGTLSGTAPSLTYTPAANFHGTDSFTFRVSDGSLDSEPATVSITVTSVNDAPIAANGSLAVVEDVAAGSTLAGSDVEGDALTFAIVAQGSKGTALITNPATGAFTYTPNANAYGEDSFTFSVNDGIASSGVATVHVTIAPVNDAPVASNVAVSALEDVPRAVVLAASDVDGDTLAFTIVQPPSYGVLSGTAPNLVYTPAANFNGTDAFTYYVSDGTVSSNVATVSIAVAAVNDAPLAAPDSATVTQNGGPTVIQVLANDSDVEGGPLAITAVTQPNGGTVAFTASAVTYTPALNFVGTSVFTYTVSDGSGGSAVGTVTVTVADGVADYGFIGLQSPWTLTPVYSAKVGSSIPLVWQYTNSNLVVVNSSGAMPEVRIRGPFACQTGETASTLETVAYPGNSGFQYFTSTNTWQFNWQTTGLAIGCYNVRIASQETGQINGPFLIRLSK